MHPLPDNTLSVRGLACAVPAARATAADLAAAFGETDARRLVRGTGVHERRLSSHCTSDLCLAAAERLLAELGWERNSISHLVLVTQTPDYPLPATACLLQHRLGLPTHCTAFDVNLGCSGYPYGLWLAGRLLEPGQRALLLVGDTIRAAPGDRSTVPLFGHAGSATALERHLEATSEAPVHFVLGTDGGGGRHILVEAGGSRLPCDSVTCQPQIRPDGNVRSQADLFMNGAEVFSFALQQVPALVEAGLARAGWTQAECDDLVFHQANGFMLKTLADKLDLPPEKIPSCLDRFGNTSSASIPLTLVTCRADELRAGRRNCLLVGFGVGWSWAAAALPLGPLVIPNLIEVP